MAAAHRLRQCGQVRFARFWFPAERARLSMFAPMIKNMRNMMNAFGALRCAQRQIVILRKIEFLSKSAQVGHERPSISAEMSQIHARIEQLGTPLRFEKRSCASARFTPAIFVAVEKIDIWICANRLPQLE